ncbi:MAG: PstS family phosphate ABC transporter substrate-binding protein [Planctomycetota bacterium]
MLLRTLLLAAASLPLVLLASCEKVSAEGAKASSVSIDGSSTVATLTGAIATDFFRDHPDISVSTSISGTGGGFKRFVRGDTDISNASRPIKASELERANSNGVSFIELPVALDGITFAVHPDNDWVDSFTMDELFAIFAQGSEVRTWADLREGWPDRAINLYVPGKDSGTYDFFKEVVFTGGQPPRDDASITVSESDNTLVRGIADDKNALGYFGFAYYLGNRDKLRSVPIVNGAGEPIRPSLETIADGSYAPFSRPLYIYVNAQNASNPALVTFVDYYLEHAGAMSSVAGYAPLTDEQYAMVKGLWQGRVTGTVWLDDEGQHIHAPLDTVYAR